MEPSAASASEVGLTDMAPEETKVTASEQVENEVIQDAGIDWKSLSIAYFSVFVDMAGVSIILPIIPFLVISFGGSGSEYGMVVASYAFAQMISVPFTGYLSDQYGRKPLLILSLAGSCGGFLFQVSLIIVSRL